MKFHILIFIFSFLQIIDCNCQTIEHVDKTPSLNVIDTLVLKKIITHQNKQDFEYSVITENDTSDFKIVFSKNENFGKITIIAQHNLLYNGEKLYKSKLKEFETILHRAEKDIDFDSLSTIVIGRLVTTGDLAIAVTNEFINKYGNRFEKSDYNFVPEFLLESKLAKDINKLFRPYSLQIDNISIEKLGFIPSEYITSSSIIETPRNEIPEKIIDCMIWIDLKKFKK